MKKLIVLISLLVACGAEAPNGYIPTGDASVECSTSTIRCRFIPSRPTEEAMSWRNGDSNAWCYRGIDCCIPLDVVRANRTRYCNPASEVPPPYIQCDCI